MMKEYVIHESLPNIVDRVIEKLGEHHDPSRTTGMGGPPEITVTWGFHRYEHKSSESVVEHILCDLMGWARDREQPVNITGCEVEFLEDDLVAIHLMVII